MSLVIGINEAIKSMKHYAWFTKAKSHGISVDNEEFCPIYSFSAFQHAPA